jgi:predicted PurR-regulated permease PerM
MKQAFFAKPLCTFAKPAERTTPVTEDRESSHAPRRVNAHLVELAIRLGLVAFLAYWSFLLVRPFLPIMVWSVVLAVALNPIFLWIAALLGGRRKAAAAILAILGLGVVIGPATWLGFGLIEAIRGLIERLDTGELSIPPPPESIRGWPLLGQQVYDFWTQASTNVRSALASILPQLRPFGLMLLEAAQSAGTGTLKFLASVIIAGFLFPPGPALVAGTKTLARRIDAANGEAYVRLAGATINAVSRGVIGISLLQAIVGGMGMWLVEVPGASLLTFLILVLGIVQIGPLIIVVPLIVWGWMTMPTALAFAFTLCMLTVNFMDNFLKPFVLARGLTTPILVIFIGVIGGVLTHGIAGLFAGPVVLAVAWDLSRAWISEGNPATIVAQPLETELTDPAAPEEP